MTTRTLDREPELMTRLVDHRVTGPDFDPRRQVLLLLQTLGEVGCVVNAPDAGARRWRNAAPDLLTVIMIAADLASHYGVPPHAADEWPDHTRIGGDGAHSALHDSHHLFAEIVEAAGWVAEWVLSPATPSPAWLVAVPTTELVARTWCLAQLWDLRDTLRVAIEEQFG